TGAVHLLLSQGFIELSQISTNHRQCLPLLLPLLKNLFPPQPLTISALVRLLRWLLAGSSAFGIEGT
ncbi:unnamed protein product, partial [Brassica oleracea var. botrytis]